MEDYKKKYEDALNAARKFKNDCPSLWNTESNPFRGVFEELKESEDVRNIQDIDSVLYYDKYLPEDTRIRLRNWLKSLEERIQPQLKQKWSEEDEALFTTANKLIKENPYNSELVTKNVVDWLKSLKERYTWKPSDEQIEALLKLEEMHVLEHEKNQENAHLYMVVKSIREQLLKLKGE